MSESRDAKSKRRKNEYTNIYSETSNAEAPQAATTEAEFNFEINRSFRQMNHYFDTSQYSFEAKCDEKSKEQPKVTKKDIERFKKRKEEKKKMKNKWLYD